MPDELNNGRQWGGGARSALAKPTVGTVHTTTTLFLLQRWSGEYLLHDVVHTRAGGGRAHVV